MKILIFNLFDIKNPRSGGSEVFTHEIAKKWVHDGNEVTMLVSNFTGGSENEKIDGINIIRLGNMYSAYLLVKKYYNKNLLGEYDIIIDEYTYRPFMAPKFVKEPVIALIHELAREKYFVEIKPILSHLLYYYFEPKWMDVYKNVPTVTVSNSTKQDLLKFNFNNINIVPEGINFKPLKSIPEKEKNPTLIFVGMLKKVNLVDHVIESFKLFQTKFPKSALWIIGRGNDLERLRKISDGLNVKFYGFVSDQKKLELMSRAHVIVVPAIREGWGLIVTEANACGTPAIGYDVPGLKDSIRDGETGILTNNNPKDFSDSLINYFEDEELRERLTNNALKWSKTFSWSKTANEFMKVIKNVLK